MEISPAVVLSRGLWAKGAQALLSTLTDIDSLQPQRDLLLEPIGSLLSDSDLQSLALTLLSKFDLKFLAPYRDDLVRMMNKEGLKHTLVHFDLMSEGGSINPQHRSQLMPVIIRLLFPSIKSTTSKRKKRGDPVLTFLSSAESHELTPLLELCFEPWSGAFKKPAGILDAVPEDAMADVFPRDWWYPYLTQGSLEFWMDVLDLSSISAADKCAVLRQGKVVLVCGF